MSLLTEDAIEKRPTAPSEPAPANPASAGAAAEAAPPAEDSARDAAAVRSELFNLRTALQRTTDGVERTARGLRLVGLLVVLGGIGSTLAVLSRPAPEQTAAPATDAAMTQQLADLHEGIRQANAQLTALNDAIALQQQKAGEQAERLARAAAGTPTRPGRIDCAKLAPDVKGVETDFFIQFQAGSAKLLPGSEATLDQMAKMLALSPGNCVLVEGHADASGNTTKNVAVSKDRAMAVVDYIAAKGGIDRANLVPIGRGSSNPPAGADAKDPANRRVTFRVVPNAP